MFQDSSLSLLYVLWQVEETSSVKTFPTILYISVTLNNFKYDKNNN